MIKLRLPEGEVLEIDFSEKPERRVLRCRQKPVLAQILANTLAADAGSASRDAELHLANKILEYCRGAKLIEASIPGYASAKVD